MKLKLKLKMLLLTKKILYHKFFSILKKFLIKEMTTNKNASKAASLVKKWKFDPNNYPKLVEILEKNCVRYM